jgi:predicted phosphate transport protein (TIGR00153 family)
MNLSRIVFFIDLEITFCYARFEFTSLPKCFKRKDGMLTILSLFGRSPFAPLQSHMESVSRCVHRLPDLCDALENKDYALIEKIANEISELEHMADVMKNDIRNHLPKSLFLPIDRGNLLDILSIQDRIADKVEDAAIIMMIKPLELLPVFKEEFKLFLKKNIEAFDGAFLIIKELNELVEYSFGGIEAEKVRSMVDGVAYKEHETDLVQRHLLKSLFHAEGQMTYTTFYQWQKIFECIGSISDLSESLAYRIRMTLEIK